MKSRISKITIGRLYNLGNYEHVRYELSVEIAEGESATTALTAVERILKALDPKRPSGVKTSAELEYAAKQIEEVKALTDEQIATRFNKSRVVVIHEAEKKLAEAKARTATWEAHQERARKALDDLGGTDEWKDAKLEWDEEF